MLLPGNGSVSTFSAVPGFDLYIFTTNSFLGWEDNLVEVIRSSGFPPKDLILFRHWVDISAAYTRLKLCLFKRGLLYEIKI